LQDSRAQQGGTDVLHSILQLERENMNRSTWIRLEQWRRRRLVKPLLIPIVQQPRAGNARQLWNADQNIVTNRDSRTRRRVGRCPSSQSSPRGSPIARTTVGTPPHVLI